MTPLWGPPLRPAWKAAIRGAPTPCPRRRAAPAMRCSTFATASVCTEHRVRHEHRASPVVRGRRDLRDKTKPCTERLPAREIVREWDCDPGRRRFRTSSAITGRPAAPHTVVDHLRERRSATSSWRKLNEPHPDTPHCRPQRSRSLSPESVEPVRRNVASRNLAGNGLDTSRLGGRGRSSRMRARCIGPRIRPRGGDKRVLNKAIRTLIPA